MPYERKLPICNGSYPGNDSQWQQSKFTMLTHDLKNIYMYIWRGGRLTSADTGCVVSSLDFRCSVCVALKEATPTCSCQSLFQLTRKCRLSTAFRHHTLGEMVWQDLEIINYFAFSFILMYLTGIFFFAIWLDYSILSEKIYCQKLCEY